MIYNVVYLIALLKDNNHIFYVAGIKEVVLYNMLIHFKTKYDNTIIT